MFLDRAELGAVVRTFIGDDAKSVFRVLERHISVAVAERARAYFIRHERAGGLLETPLVEGIYVFREDVE